MTRRSPMPTVLVYATMATLCDRAGAAAMAVMWRDALVALVIGTLMRPATTELCS